MVYIEKQVDYVRKRVFGEKRKMFFFLITHLFRCHLSVLFYAGRLIRFGFIVF